MRVHGTLRLMFARIAVASGVILSASVHAQTVNSQVVPVVASVTTVPTSTPSPSETVAVSDVSAEGTLVRMGRSETVIDAPMEMVVRAMTDFTSYSEFMPHVRESRIVRRNRGATDVYVQVPLGGSLGVIWALLRIDTQRQPNRVELRGHSVDSNMDRFDTHAVIERIEGSTPRTRLVFEVLALPRLPFPSSVFTREMRDAARTVSNNLRARVATQLALNTLPRPAVETTGARVPPSATSRR
jgi:hypothetical protein